MISVIITLYNKETSVQQTIESVLTQTYPNFEIIVVDDGSTDDGPLIVSSIHDNRIRLFKKSNGGVSSTRNFGIGKAQGDFILFLDGDDHLLPDALLNLFNLINKFPDADIYTGNYTINENNNSIKICSLKKKGYIDNNFKSFWLDQIHPRVGNTLFKKKVFNNKNLYNTNLSKYEDLEFNMRVLPYFRIAYTPEKILTYNRAYSKLSKDKVKINNEYCWHIKLNIKDKYATLILANNINHSLYNKIKIRDIHNAVKLLLKHIRKIHILIYALIKYFFLRIRFSIN